MRDVLILRLPDHWPSSAKANAGQMQSAVDWNGVWMEFYLDS